MNAALESISLRNSKSSITLSVVLILLGMLAIALPGLTSFGVVRVLAWLIIFDGVTQLVQAFRSEGGGRAIWRFLSGCSISQGEFTCSFTPHWG